MHLHSTNRPLSLYELNCSECSKWFRLDDKQLAQVNERLAEFNSPSARSVPMQSATCPHCNANLHVPMPGKYDRPNQRRSDCAVQYVVTVDDPRISK